MRQSHASVPAGLSSSARPSPRAVVRVDIVDPQPLIRVGLTVAVSEVPGMEPGRVCASTAELDRRGGGLVIVGLTPGDGAAMTGAIRLAEHGRTVLVLVPEDGAATWAQVRDRVAGGVSRHAPLSRITRALRALATGESHWRLDPPATVAPGPTALDLLSTRERELLGLLAAGCSDREIAEQLQISIRTVWSHLDRIREKTRVRGRVELAMLVWRPPTQPRPVGITCGSAAAPARRGSAV